MTVAAHALGRRLLLLPAFVYLVAFYVGPLAFVLALSIFTFRQFNFLPELTLANYVEVLTGGIFLTVFIRTAVLSLLSTVIAVFVAYTFSYVITFSLRPYRHVLYFLVLINLFGGYLVRVYSWRTILGQEGIINGTLVGIGAIDAPIAWLLNSPFSITIALVNVLVPLAIVPIYAAMQNVAPGVVESARDLGSSGVDLNRRVIVPLVMPGLRVAFIFSFIASMSEFGIPSLLGGVGTQFIGNVIQFHMGTSLNWPLAAALSVTLVVVATGLGVVLSNLLRVAVK